MIKNWIDKIGDFYDKQQSLFDATEGFTNLQREFGAREFKAYKAQAQYEAYSKALVKSLIISSICSIPTANRINPSSIPSSFLISAGTF